jgi:nitric oxide reductase large subunit
MLTIPPIHTAFHFTSNTPAHAHVALGSIVMIFLAAGLSLIPILSRRELSSPGKITTASGYFITGIFVIFMFQTSAGVLQATAFINGLSISDWLPMFKWLQLGVLAGGLICFAGILMLGLPMVFALISPGKGSKRDGGGG